MRAIPFVLCSMTTTASAAEVREKLAVLEIEARGVDPKLAQNTASIVSAQVRKRKRFDVISKEDIEKLMHFEESRQAVGATSQTGAIAAMAGDLGIAKLMHGSLGKMGSLWVLSLSLMDSQTATVLASDTVTINGKEGAIVEPTKQLVDRLFALLDEREAKK